MTQDQKAFDQKIDGVAPIPVQPPADVTQEHPKRKEALEQFAKFQRGRRFGVSVDIRNIAAQLNPQKPRASFPEVLFVEYFLPMFAAEVPETQDVNYQTWIEKVSGGWDQPVDILGEDEKVLFTIPPFLDVSVLEQVRPGGKSMTHIERYYSRLKEVDAQASQTYLSKTLGGMHIKEKPSPEVISNIKTWNAIYERYGRKDKIINLGNILDHDPNKDAVVLGAGPSVSNKDVGDYELDTD